MYCVRLCPLVSACVRGIPMAVENDLVPLVLTDQSIVLFGKLGERFTSGEGAAPKIIGSRSYRVADRRVPLPDDNCSNSSSAYI